MDFVAGTFDGITSLMQSGDLVERRRPPRHVTADGVVTPYSPHESLGAYFLRTLKRGAFAKDT